MMILEDVKNAKLRMGSRHWKGRMFGRNLFQAVGGKFR